MTKCRVTLPERVTGVRPGVAKEERFLVLQCRGKTIMIILVIIQRQEHQCIQLLVSRECRPIHWPLLGLLLHWQRGFSKRHLAAGVADMSLWASRELAPLPGVTLGGDRDRTNCSASLLTVLSLYLRHLEFQDSSSSHSRCHPFVMSLHQ